ncbi:MAG: trimeric intracellular cation channel family protein, partial [Nitrosarchaeum sp.]
MVDFSIPANVFIYILDLFGTMAFAVTGAFKAIEHKSDIVGILLLATITGIAGGTIRDVVMGQFPNSLSDPAYVVITILSGIAIFFLYSHLKKHWNLFLKF